eukprot:s7776_g1.t1
MLSGRFGGLLPRSYSRLLSKEEAVLARFDDREPFDLRMAPRRPLAFYFDVLKEADGRRSRTWSVTVLAEGRPVEPVTQKRGRKLLQAFSERLAGQGIELDALLDSPASTKRFNAFLVCYGRQVGLIPSILGGHRRRRQKGVGSEKNGCSPCGIYLLPGCVKIRIRITLPFPGKLCWRHYPVFDVGLVTCCRHAGNDMGSGDAHRQQEVDENELSLDESMALRKKQVAKFQEDEREMFNNLNSVRSAQVALNTSSFPSFLQRPADTPIRLLRAVAERQADHLKSESRQQLMAFLQDPTSGSVRGVIDGLETDFEGRKEIDSAKVQIATKKEEKTAADEERLQKKQAVKDAKGSVEEDLAFARKVQKQCDAKGQEWDKRQKIRGDELQAVSKAVEILDSDDSFDLFGKTMAPSFLQLASKKAPAMPQQIYDRLLALGKAHDARLQGRIAVWLRFRFKRRWMGWQRCLGA